MRVQHCHPFVGREPGGGACFAPALLFPVCSVSRSSMADSGAMGFDSTDFLK